MLIDSYETIAQLIPVPRPGTNDIVQLSDREISVKPIYAIVVDPNSNVVASVYRVFFSIFSSSKVHYMFLNSYIKELSSTTLYVSADAHGTMKPTKEDWGFKTDKIGLYIITGTRYQAKVYFSTKYEDANVVRKSLLPVEKCVTTETVYI